MLLLICVVEAPRSLVPSSFSSDGRSHTGPKGVIDDFNEAKKNLNNLRMRQKIQRERNQRQQKTDIYLQTNVNFIPSYITLPTLSPFLPSLSHSSVYISLSSFSHHSDHHHFNVLMSVMCCACLLAALVGKCWGRSR